MAHHLNNTYIEDRSKRLREMAKRDNHDLVLVTSGVKSSFKTTNSTSYGDRIMEVSR